MGFLSFFEMQYILDHVKVSNCTSVVGLRVNCVVTEDCAPVLNLMSAVVAGDKN